MAELCPASLRDLSARLFSELREQGAIFDLPKRSFWLGDEARDYSVAFHGERASTPIGPAAGPQSQMSQNIVLAWLAGARIVELKTVQRNDRLTIPRPCIDARTVGYNVEWSQELRLEESLGEYVNAWMLIAMLRAAGLPSARAAGPQGHTLFDLSAGYDLAGISSPPIRGWLESLRDARSLIDARRGELPARFRDIDIDPRIGKSITLSTFHGCPAGEIERICEFLLCELGLSTVVKMNPTLLGYEEVERVLHDVLGYRHIALDRAAFEHDMQWSEAVAMAQRLRALAEKRGLGFGAKFTNTLVVKNTDTFFSDPTMYLSGQPLYVLASTLALRFRDAVGSALPISFSAGIERHNVADAVAMGFTPITMCTDLLRPGGYARLHKYLGALGERMDAVGATTRDELILRATPEAVTASAGAADAAAVQRAAHANARVLVAAAQTEPRYHFARNAKAPRKVGSALHLFDCISCDKCVPVCPNDANFVYEAAPRELTLDVLRYQEGTLVLDAGPRVRIERSHQLANFADFCNECGNCDVFCPEDGGPFIEKPRFFGRLADLQADHRAMGFWLAPGAPDERELLVGRMHGRSYRLELDRARGIATFTDGVLSAELTARSGALRRASAAPHAPDGHTLPLGTGRELLTLLRGLLETARATPVHAPRLRQPEAGTPLGHCEPTAAVPPPKDPQRETSIC